MKKNKKGFTLIELILAMAIMLIVGIAISTIFSSTTKLNKVQSNKLTLEENCTFIQRSMYNDIRRASVIVDGAPDDVTNRWIFKGSNMDQNNAYCRLKGYKPLLYIESIMGYRGFYAYDSVTGELRKITIPNDNTTTIVNKYFTNSLTYDNTTKGTQWSVIPENQMLNYTPPNINYDINDEVIIKGLVINYDSTNDGKDNPIAFNDFTKIGAFIKKERNVETGRYVVLKSNIQDVDGKCPWFILPIKPESLVYYTNTKDSLIGKYLVNQNNADGIIINKNSPNDAGESLKGYYDVQLCTKKDNLANNFEFRVSTVDYGGDIK